MANPGIFALTPFTLQDYPGHCACILWVAGCNMRCAYCHNPQIVHGEARHTFEEICNFLSRRRHLLDGIVVSGGEASYWQELPALLTQARQLGYRIKLDTNGLRPDLLQRLLQQGLVDTVALDYKAGQQNFRHITGTSAYRHFSCSLDLMCANQHRLSEIRTTVHTGLMDEDDINAIMADLAERGFTGLYAIQNFCGDNGRPTLGQLGAQPRLLRRDALACPESFTVVFRNFPTVAASLTA